MRSHDGNRLYKRSPAPDVTLCDLLLWVMSSIDQQQEVFERFCSERFGENGCQTSKTIAREKGQKIIHRVRNDPIADSCGSWFKFLMKQQGFSLVRNLEIVQSCHCAISRLRNLEIAQYAILSLRNLEIAQCCYAITRLRSNIVQSRDWHAISGFRECAAQSWDCANS